MLYRPRREDYKHSMAAAIEITTFDQLQKFVNADCNTQSLLVSVNDIGANQDISTRYIVCIQYPEREWSSAMGYLLDSPGKLGMIKNKEPNSDRSYEWYYPITAPNAQECDATNS
jgi:hypothetical protein